MLEINLIALLRFRRDCNKYNGGLMFYISEGIPCKVLTNLTVSSNAELISIDITKWRKWLLLGVYKPPVESDSEGIIRIFNHCVPSYEDILLLGDHLNMTTENNMTCTSHIIRPVTSHIIRPVTSQIDNPTLFWLIH